MQSWRKSNHCLLPIAYRQHGPDPVQGKVTRRRGGNLKRITGGMTSAINAGDTMMMFILMNTREVMPCLPCF
jgi:hypothetical protein